jgi:hypothetical protein
MSSNPEFVSAAALFLAIQMLEISVTLFVTLRYRVSICTPFAVPYFYNRAGSYIMMYMADSGGPHFNVSAVSTSSPR